jgi:DNA-binding response OmpR family regulator
VNILIVEDDAFYLDIIVKMVRGWTHDVTCAESGWAALEKAAAMDFDLFLLDVFLPDMTAMELIPRLRSFRPDARIITLTGQSTRELERELRELGIAYYMAKPASQKELKSILDHMSRGPKPRTSPPHASVMESAS